MANILYGMNGEGSGHWTRSKEVINYLKSKGHNIKIVTSGRALANLKDQFEVEEVFGFELAYTKGRLNELATFFKNINAVPRGAMSIKKVMELIDREAINLIITDFEPISSIVSNIKKIPAISIDNQHFITNTDAERPAGYAMQEEVAKAVIEMLTAGAETYVTISFFEANPKNDKTIIVPPIVRREVLELKPTTGDYILVYLTHGLGQISETLKSVNYKFIFYGADEDRTDGNIEFRKFDRKKFLQDLAGSAGVMATSGFSLISEALYLGKPYFAWPAKNQFEQTFNAFHLERLGYGKFSDELTADGIESFLFNIENYRKRVASYPYRDNEILFRKLDELIEKYTVK